MKKITMVLAGFTLFANVSCSDRTGMGSASIGVAPGKAVVSVNGLPITDEECLAEYRALPDFARDEYAGAEGARRFLDELVTRETFYQAALAEGLDKDPDYLTHLRSYQKSRLAALLIQKKMSGSGKITDERAKKYYEDHKNDFQVPEKIEVAHILVDTLEEAAAIRSALMKGAAFQRLAKEKSIDTQSASKGGELAPFSRGSMAPEFENAAFALKIGEISPPVKTKFGYHLIKLLNRFEAEQVEFDRISDFIRSRLEDDIRQEAMTALNLDLREKARISAVDEAVLKAALNRLGTDENTPRR